MTEPLTVADGCITLPDGAGCAGLVDWDKLAAYGAAGATDVRVGAQAPTESEAERTRELLAALAQESAA